jgi:hypothetical protein
MPTEERYRELVKAFAGQPGVTTDGKGFGAGALKVRGKIFAMLSSRGEFVVKLPRRRVDELIRSRAGAPFDAGKGKPMKEWVAVPENSATDWVEVASEAMRFVRNG